MSTPKLGAAEEYWRKVYENRFLDLAYKVMVETGVSCVVIDAEPDRTAKVVATLYQDDMKIQIKLRDSGS